MTVLYSEWHLGDAVHIDRDESITAYVTAIMFRQPDPPTYEVQWLHNGSNQTAWVVGWRLTKASS